MGESCANVTKDVAVGLPQPGNYVKVLVLEHVTCDRKEMDFDVENWHYKNMKQNSDVKHLQAL